MKQIFAAIVVLFISIPAHAQTVESIKAKRYEMSLKKQTIYDQMVMADEAVTENQTQYDVLYYSLELSPDPERPLLEGKVLTTVKVLSDSLRYLEFNLLNNMKVQGVSRADSSNHSLSFTHQNDLVRIELERNYQKYERVGVIIDYNGLPRSAFGFNSYQNKPMIWTLSEPFGARAWWPCKDVPSDKADSVDIRVTVPEGLIVASNGSLRSTDTINGKTTYWWHEQYPIVTYLISLAIHPYDVSYDDYIYNQGQDTMKIHFYMFPDQAFDLKPLNGTTKHMIAAFAGMFGEYPFVKEKYGHAAFLGGGAMEHQTCTSFSFWGEWVVAHELAHQWWGDLITCNSFHHIWLNEGFATYSEALWYEYQGGTGGASYYQMHNSLYLGPGTVYVEDPATQSIFDGNLSYNKASWVLHMLRHVVGDSTFFKILKTYYASPAHSYGTATTEEFQAICEQVSGMDLSVFFHQWIYNEGYPDYHYFWTTEQLSDGQYNVELHITQNQAYTTVFEMPVDITIRTSSGDTTIVLNVDEARDTFEIIMPEEPNDIMLDPNNWVLKTATKIEKPVYSLCSVVVNDSLGNGNGVAEPGETADITIKLENSGTEVSQVEWQLRSDDSTITIQNGVTSFETIAMASLVSNADDPFRIHVDSQAANHVAWLTLLISDGMGHRDSLFIRLPIGWPDVLYVDDDLGQNYEQYVQSLLDVNGVMYETWNVDDQGIPDSLNTYKTVLWTTGDDRTTSLTDAEQQALAGFLEAGGRLLLSGQNIGYDLVEDGTQKDKNFYASVLHAKYIGDNANDDWAFGVADDIVGQNLWVFITGDFGTAANQNSTDIIDPIDGAISFLDYMNLDHSAGIRYQNEVNGSRLIYLPFGLEGMSNPVMMSARELYAKTMTWLASDEATAVSGRVKAPLAFQLKQNYPNPFNPETVIHYSIQKSGLVSLTILNIQGQEVANLVNETRLPGQYQAVWNGRTNEGHAAPTGMYLYRLESNGNYETRKMLLLR